MTLPNFLVIGAEKSGTTALHELLATHPQVFMSEPKEPSFFLSQDRRYLAQDLLGQPHADIRTQAEYERIFVAAAAAKAIGESSPCYLYSAEAAQLIKATIPDVRIVALLRNPAERAFSQFTFNKQRGWEPLSRTFREALELEEERVQGNSMWAFHYTRRGMYARQLAPYINAFADRVRVWAYDDFVEKPAHVLREICEFCEIEEIALAEPPARRNVTSLPRSGLMRQLLDRPNLIRAMARGLMPNRARSALGGMLRRMNTRRPARDDESVRSLIPVFEEDIRQLAATILPKAADWLRG